MAHYDTGGTNKGFTSFFRIALQLLSLMILNDLISSKELGLLLALTCISCNRTWNYTLINRRMNLRSKALWLYSSIKAIYCCWRKKRTRNFSSLDFYSLKSDLHYSNNLIWGYDSFDFQLKFQWRRFFFFLKWISGGYSWRLMIIDD